MRIKQLYVYPVKSLRGCAVPSATLTAHGLKYDREYMVVRVKVNEDGSEIYESQYVGRVDALCLFSASFLPNYEDAKVIRVTYNTPLSSDEKDGFMGNIDGDPYVEFPVDLDYKRLKKVDLNIHHASCVGYDMGSEFQEFFTKHLGYPAKLVYVGDSTREVKGNLAPNQTHLTKENDFDKNKKTIASTLNGWFVFSFITWILGYLMGWNMEKYTLRFADVAPVLVTSTVSLEELNRGKKEGEESMALDITKMRPNILLEPSNAGELSPFEEDFWAELEIGGKVDGDRKRIVLTGNCGRCKSLNVDYETGKQLPIQGQMLKRLADIKRKVDAGHGYSPVFGRYGFIAKDSLEKQVKIGEEVAVTKKNEDRTVFYWPGLSAGTKPKK